MLTSEEKFVAWWAPRKGRKAAKLSWRALKYQIYARMLLGLFATPCSLIGGLLDIPVLLGIGIACLVAGFGYANLSLITIKHSNKAASKAIGMRIGFLHTAGPPRTNEHYLQWCHKHGITPYAAADPTPQDEPAIPPKR